MASTPPHSTPTRLGISIKPVWLVWILVILAGLALLQDIISAWVHGTAFYWSEALLFKVYWFLFLPLGYAFFLFNGRHSGSSAPLRMGLRVLVASLILGGAHVLLFATILYGVSELFFAESFSFYWAVEKNFSVHFYKYLAAYFGISAAVVAYHHYLKGSWTKDAAREPSYPETLLLQAGRKRIPVPAGDIVSIHADSPYVAVHAKGNVYLQTSTLRHLEESLDPSVFVRVHRSAIANVRCITEMKSRMNGDYDLQMSDGREIRLSRRYAQALKDKLPLLAPAQPA